VADEAEAEGGWAFVCEEVVGVVALEYAAAG